ncbi:hypothetical protein E8E13_002420 [Curvularia kusanoi]|uniref:Isochorismatase-like domain-containing protein n=1 Tax=Curvularia kusanoi TaxID=90978 RepID=A0A9P4W7C7_CURKU|nr:hypothetical protein E8E13_002420 [Curvularia kusanoi]
MATPTPHRKSMVGSKTNFWLHSSTQGFDLSHPSTATTPSPTPLLTISTTTSPITLSPPKTALIIIDMQNFFLSPSLGHSTSSPGHRACSALLASAIPAARKAGIRIVWVNWGLTAAEVESMPAGVKRAFGFYSIDGGAEHDVQSVVTGGVVEGSVGVDRHGKESGRKSAYRGIGADMGDLEVAGGGKVEAGRLLMRDTWNADLYPPLKEAFEAGKGLKEKPDVWVHKNRMSALWGPETELELFLKKEGITSLLFAGVNTDQCVGGTLTDAFSKGYDCILLSDGCGTSSPGYAQECWEFNAAHTFGFCASCKDLADGVDKMGK